MFEVAIQSSEPSQIPDKFSDVENGLLQYKMYSSALVEMKPKSYNLPGVFFLHPD